MISQTAEYSLRAVACLARQSEVPMTARQVADAVCIPAGYLAKILQTLAKAGVVTSQRGLNGGFLLARRPEELTLLDVVRVADGSHRITACPLNIPAHGPELCPRHRRLDEAAAHVEQMLASVTIADVLAQPMCTQDPTVVARLEPQDRSHPCGGACRPAAGGRNDAGVAQSA